MAHSVAFRECVVRNIRSGMPWETAKSVFSVSSYSIGKWLKMASKSGNLSDPPRKYRKPKKIDPDLLRAAFDQSPDATLEEIAAQFNCWPQSIHKRCVKLGITRKKNDTIRRAKRGKKASVSGGD